MTETTSPRGRRLGPGLLIGLCLFVLAVLVAIIAPPFASNAANVLSDDRSLPPSGDHWLGTNSFGQDNVSRVLVASRLTLIMTIAA